MVPGPLFHDDDFVAAIAEVVVAENIEHNG
jgi:hypothetical protein